MPTAIESIIRERIVHSAEGWLAFAEVMNAALYDQEHGYYGSGPTRIGRCGDFYTAVSVGPLYGRHVALLADRVWRALGEPDEFAIVEQGAHDGQLMEDVLHGLATDCSALASLAQFVIIEPNEACRHAQVRRLDPLLSGRISWLPDVAGLEGGPASLFFVANELLDAFPVRVVRWDGNRWDECVVGLSGDGQALVWRQAVIRDPELAVETQRLPRDLPAGYTTEISLAAIRWGRQLARVPFRGAVMIADYGFDHDEFYAPYRVSGTLRRYHRHRMDERVLEGLGDCDLTAHVNFSRVIEAAGGNGYGLKLLACCDQGRFLTRLAAPWLRGFEARSPAHPDPAMLRQFQTLTHPAHMGAKFRICLLGRDLRFTDFADLSDQQPAGSS